MKTYKIVKAKNNKSLVGEEITMEIVKKQSKPAKIKQSVNSKYVSHEEFDDFKSEMYEFKKEMNEFKKEVNSKFDNINGKIDSMYRKFDILFKHLGINE